MQRYINIFLLILLIFLIADIYCHYYVPVITLAWILKMIFLFLNFISSYSFFSMHN